MENLSIFFFFFAWLGNYSLLTSQHRISCLLEVRDATLNDVDVSFATEEDTDEAYLCCFFLSCFLDLFKSWWHLRVRSFNN